MYGKVSQPAGFSAPTPIDDGQWFDAQEGVPWQLVARDMGRADVRGLLSDPEVKVVWIDDAWPRELAPEARIAAWESVEADFRKQGSRSHDGAVTVSVGEFQDAKGRALLVVEVSGCR
jgi:hypothetical protein